MDRETTVTADDDRLIDTEQQYSLGLINDAFSLGYHCWWILGFVLSFGLFTMVLAFVTGVLDSNSNVASTSAGDIAMKNLQTDDSRLVDQTVDRLTRLEGARRALGYPLLHNVPPDRG